MDALEKIISTQSSIADMYTSDSRKVKSKSIFVALAGQNSDGHAFVDQALKSGAMAVWVDEKKNRWPQNEKVFATSDTHVAHRLLAKKFREKFKGKVIAIAGSSGKTSTKEFLFTLVSSQFNCIKTQASQNGHLGIPLTLEQLHAGVEVAVVEVGIDGPGDMFEHANIVQPDLCVMTSIGEEHLRQLKDLEGVFREERILADQCLARGGQVFIPEADHWLEKLATHKQVIKAPSLPSALIKGVKIDWASEVMNRNIALAIKTALHLGVSENLIQSAISKLSIPKGRGAALEIKKNYWIIEDHYNSNPSSLKAALSAARTLSEEKQLPLNLFLGDMLDLGENTKKLHSDLVDFIKNLKFEKLFFIGDEFKNVLDNSLRKQTQCFSNSSEAAEWVQNNTFSEGIFLFKGSRGMALEKCLDRFKEKLNL